MMKISILIPAFNEQDTIIEVLEQIARQSIDGFETEVIIIDDGSKDKTTQIVESRPELYTKLLKLSVNGGKGTAVKAGLKEATGDFILFQDADLEYDPADYAKLFLPVTRFDADLVMGSRMVAPEYTRVSYFWNKVGNRLITLTFNILNNTTFTDIYSCYLMFKRDMINLDQIKSKGWEQHAEILSLATRKAVSMYEVPISYHGRTHSEGKKIRAHHIFSILWMIIKKRLSG